VRPEHGGIGTAMPRVVDDVDVAAGDGDSSAGAYGRLLCHQRRMHEQVDPRWRRQHCGAGLACDHDPPHWARGATPSVTTGSRLAAGCWSARSSWAGSASWRRRMRHGVGVRGKTVDGSRSRLMTALPSAPNIAARSMNPDGIGDPMRYPAGDRA
jgi:hypothetical protein